MKLSKYITLSEATKSTTALKFGLSNQPNAEQIEAMKYVALNVFDPCREFVKGALHASSFFRSPEVNTRIGGSATSQHCKGEAIDMDCDTFGNGTNKELFHYIKDNLIFDQEILEYPDAKGNPAWVHVSLKKSGNRKQVLVKLKDRYINYSDYKIGMV
jgi:hypothetical protein